MKSMKNCGLLGILAFALLLRLYHIDFPIAGHHSWRQADTAAIARNFSENGFNLFYPRVDWDGSTPGFVEAEFQVYPFLVSLLYALFGAHVVFGRVLSVCFSIATVYGLYLVARKHVGKNVALWAVFLYAILPLNVYFGRAFMPEAAMLMCSVFGVYWFSQWLDTGRVKDFLLAVLCISLAALLKIPALYLGLPLVFLVWLRFGRGIFKQWKLWLFAVLVLLPVALWYYHAHQLFLNSGLSFGIWGFGTDKWGNREMIFTGRFYSDIFLKRIAELHFAYGGFILFVVGLFVKRNSRAERLFDYWIIAVIVYFIIVARGNQVHDYYQLPFMLPAVVFAGKALNKYVPSGFKLFEKKHVVGLFLLICILGIFGFSYSTYDGLMRLETYDSSLFRLAESVKTRTSRNDLLVTVSEYDPVVLYACERKGWRISLEQVDSAFLEAIANKGAKYLVGETRYFTSTAGQKVIGWLYREYNLLEKGPDYFIISLR